MNYAPLNQLATWLRDAADIPGIAQPAALALATCSKDAMPSVRIVLLKNLDERGLVFYTNAHSKKGQELAENPRASACFYWGELGRQVRIEGKIEPVNSADADAYFASRPRESQIGAWASDQSQPLASYASLEQRFSDIKERYYAQTIPRPEYWQGYRLVPLMVEFWQEGPHRLHYRDCYRRHDPSKSWEFFRLNP